MMKNSLFRTCGKLFQIVQNMQGIGLIFISKGSSKFRPKIRANLFVRLIVGRLWNLRFLFLVSSFRRLLINLLSWRANFFHRLNISLLLACIHLAKSPWKWMLIYKFSVELKTLNKQDMTPVAGKNQRIKSPWSKHREIARLARLALTLWCKFGRFKRFKSFTLKELCRLVIQRCTLDIFRQEWDNCLKI